jgi:uncharacterized protein YhaN
LASRYAGVSTERGGGVREGPRIEPPQVHGFGHFAGYKLELRPGLNLLYGPNEAGKSTLLAFIRTLLVGFEKRGRAEQRYEPESGTCGGELSLSTGIGPLVVRRVVERRGRAVSTVCGPEGETLPPARLEEALAYVTRELFSEVFAFGLEELSSFEKLTEEASVSRALFAAGIQGGRRLPELEKQAGELFKPGGRNPLLNQVLRELEEVRGKLRAVEDRPARYFEERERLASLTRQQEETRALQEGFARELGRLSRLEAALEDLGELGRLRAELSALLADRGFPLEFSPRRALASWRDAAAMSEHFGVLTEGRYRRVFIPAGGRHELRVTDGRRAWSAEQLSRGTREQLYLAFRLAVIQYFGETRGALPLVVDDILVNFDLERTRLPLKLLANLAERHQVIAFTCHAWLAELLEAEGARVTELAPGTLSPGFSRGRREWLRMGV